MAEYKLDNRVYGVLFVLTAMVAMVSDGAGLVLAVICLYVVGRIIWNLIRSEPRFPGV